MSASLLHLFLLLSFPLLAGLGAAGLMIANAEKRQQALSSRIANTLPHAQRVVGPVPIARETVEAPGPATRIAALFGCNLVNAHVYPVRWWLLLGGTCALGRVAAALALPLAGPAGWLAWPIAWLLASRTMFAAWDAKRRSALLQQFPDILATIVRSVRVGIPVSEAIRMVAREAPDPSGREFRQLADEMAIGVPLDAALYAMSLRSGLPEYRFFATTVGLQAQTGGTLGEALDTLADVVRRRIAMRARGYALTSEARASAIVLAAMPFLIGCMMFLLTPDYMSVLFTTPTGHKMLGAASISLAIGIAAMQGLIRKVLS
jgi:tight adherence protein B